MHRERVAQDVRSLEARAGRTNGRFWLYFAFDLVGDLTIETSWLPDCAQVAKVLSPLGFKRLENGAYRRVVVLAQTDEMTVMRSATKALGVLLKEGYL